MKIQQCFRRALRAEHGSQSLEAAGAALAAALLVLALLFGARTMLGPSVERAFECAAAALGAGGADCGGGGSAGTTPSNTSQAPPAEEEEEDCGFLCDVGGFFKGGGEVLWETVKGIGTLAWDGVQAATGDQETRDKYVAAWEAITSDPGGALSAIWHGIADPIQEDWEAGREGEAIGRAFTEIASVFFGPKGVDKLGKLNKVDDIARAADRVGDTARAADRISDTARALEQFDELPDAVRAAESLPCVASAPGGKGPGLAKPVLAPCVRINVEHLFHGEINRRGRAVGFHHRASIGHEGKARIVPGTETTPNANGVFQARVEVFDPATNTWVTKNAPSTFFPDSWNRGQVLTEVRGAFGSATFPDPARPNYWEGVSPSGVRIGGYLDNAGNINTAFPLP